MLQLHIRHLQPDDYELVSPIVDEWWGGRPVRALLPRLFFEHFNNTSFAVGPPKSAQAFLIGFQSQSFRRVGYIHFAGVNPAMRGKGFGRLLYENFFKAAATLGCTEVQCITSPINTGSIAFHQKMGFMLHQGNGEANGIPVVLNYAGEGQHRILFRRPLSPSEACTYPSGKPGHADYVEP
jgi:GNAT superfamily N-acetyltransferase